MHFDSAVPVARVLISRGEPERAWTLLFGELKRWIPVDGCQMIAPAALVVDPVISTIITPERREQIWTGAWQGESREIWTERMERWRASGLTADSPRRRWASSRLTEFHVCLSSIETSVIPRREGMKRSPAWLASRALGQHPAVGANPPSSAKPMESRGQSASTGTSVYSSCGPALSKPPVEGLGLRRIPASEPRLPRHMNRCYSGPRTCRVRTSSQRRPHSHTTG